MASKKLDSFLVFTESLQFLLNSIIRFKLLGRILEIVQEKQFRTPVCLKELNITVYSFLVVL